MYVCMYISLRQLQAPHVPEVCIVSDYIVSDLWCVCMRDACIHPRKLTFTYTYMYVYIYIHTSIHIYVYIYIHTSIHIYTYIHTYIQGSGRMKKMLRELQVCIILIGVVSVYM
jgi:hypothetical protein